MEPCWVVEAIVKDDSVPYNRNWTEVCPDRTSALLFFNDTVENYKSEKNVIILLRRGNVIYNQIKCGT